MKDVKMTRLITKMATCLLYDDSQWKRAWGWLYFLCRR